MKMSRPVRSNATTSRARRGSLIALAALSLLLLPATALADDCCAMQMCFNLDPATCQLIGGTPFPGQFGCDPYPCGSTDPIGACCSSFGCGVGPETACTGAGGTWIPGTSCNPDPCNTGPMGACCLFTGMCQMATQNGCQVAGGVYQGNNTSCTPDPCGSSGTGACCSPTGCQITNAAQCSAAGGNYLGDGMMCTPDPCPAGPCDLNLIVPVQSLHAVRSGSSRLDVSLSWQADPNAHAYNTWYVVDKTQIPASSTQGGSLSVCSNSGLRTCTHGGAVFGFPGTHYFYNVIGVCNGSEAPR